MQVMQGEEDLQVPQDIHMVEAVEPEVLAEVPMMQMYRDLVELDLAHRHGLGFQQVLDTMDTLVAAVVGLVIRAVPLLTMA
jgi:hypothetical protein